MPVSWFAPFDEAPADAASSRTFSGLTPIRTSWGAPLRVPDSTRATVPSGSVTASLPETFALSRLLTPRKPATNAVLGRS